MPLVLRSTKGSALTYEEMDENFAWLANNATGGPGGNVSFASVLATGNVVSNGTFSLSYNGASFSTANTSYYTDIWLATPPFQYHSYNAGLGLYSWGSSASDGFDVNFMRSRSGTQGVHTLVQNGDELMYMGIGGSDGTRFRPAADIRVDVDGTPVAGGNIPGRISFFTTQTDYQYPIKRMEIASNGNVIIQKELMVTGNVIIGSELFYLSDRSLKTNIQDIYYSTDIIDMLRPVTFNWIASGRKEYGFIAQDVEKILPEIVHDNNAGLKSISPLQLISVLTAAIKEQQQRINQLEIRLERLENT